MAPSPTASSPARRALLLGLFLVTATTLTVEVLLTRLLSVITWYSLAFLVIGMGLFGLTVGAVRVYLRPERYVPERLALQLARDSVALALAIPTSLVLLLVMPLRIELAATTVLLFLLFAATLSLPFIAAGSIVAACLTRAPIPIGRLYAVDLLGAALGAPLVPALLSVVDASSALLAMATVSALASLAFATASSDRPAARRSVGLAVLLSLCTALNAWSDHGLVPLWVKGHAEDRSKVALEAWNSHSRVQVSTEWIGPPVFWGRGTCPESSVAQRWITIDGDAGTALYRADPDVRSLRFLGCDVTSLVHQVRPSGPVAIIGVGGSRDLQTALKFGHEDVVGIELNGRLLDILRGPLGAPAGVASSPYVRLEHDDGRSWLARSTERFAVIQMSLVDTWAATGAGAHALGENGLYTVEAWTTFLDHLAPGGVFSVSRWHQGGARDETARLVALATATLLERGVADPRTHLALFASGKVATLLVSVEPFSEADLARLDSAEKRLGFTALMRPGVGGLIGSAVAELGPIAACRTREALDALTLTDSFDLRAPTDDRPFFFNMLRLRAWLTPLPDDAGGPIEGNRRATMTLALAFATSCVLVVVAIVLPLWLRRRSERSQGRGSDRQRPPLGLLTAGVVYFATIGVAFMLAEIGLLQRLGLLLGHPDYSLIVVLASLVGGAGVGAWASDRYPLDRAPHVYLPPILCAVWLSVLAVFLPSWALALAAEPLSTRIVVAATVSGSMGALLGTAFPTGIRVFGPRLPDETPWLWGINGVGGVLASSGGVILAHELGLRWLFLTAGACYVLLMPLLARGRLGRDASP